MALHPVRQALQSHRETGGTANRNRSCTSCSRTGSMNFVKAIFRWVLFPVRLASALAILLVAGLFHFIFPEWTEGLSHYLAQYVWRGI
jgi:hypothetical protein